ncbi:hypothetical protein EDS67_03800 [candidate division KSB1 bacterium]|nr:MAG: hypothetical protein EDS67_03800 [candidate division KSB1 bacterium]MDL1875738.1 hypothetical protein [Cytophagia bacterium CHB2]
MKTNPIKKRRRYNHSSKATGSSRPNGQPLSVPVSIEQIVQAVKKMKKNDQRALIEDLLAATSPDYLASIREAREDYRRGRVRTHHDVFSKLK